MDFIQVSAKTVEDAVLEAELHLFYTVYEKCNVITRSSRLLKLDTMKISEGCTHGLEIDYKSFLDAVSILKNRNIAYSING